MSVPAIATRLPLPVLVEFCQRHKIARLEAFGSVLRDDFGPESDVDLLYVKDPSEPWSLFDKMDAQDELETLLHRKVDFVSRRAIEGSRNWVLRKAILEHSQVLYGA
ncbi:MAG: nucleotidyltransferase domain-containing protein [bacterium]